jgi:general secretion pathway protein E
MLTMSATWEPTVAKDSPWARCVESIQKRCPQDLSAKFAWDAASGENPWQWAERAGIAETVQLEAFAEVLGVGFVTDLSALPSSPSFLAEIPIAYARRHVMLGLSENESFIKLALGRRVSWPQVDVLRRLLRRDVEPLLAPPEEVQRMINIAYQQRTGEAQTLLESMDRSEVLGDLEALSGREDLLDVAGRAPVIRLVNLILFEAVKGGASDVHIQPYENRLVARFRIDGILFDAFDVPKPFQEEVVSRIKVLGKMNIAEKRLPQDGRATVQVGDRRIDLRIASLPGSHGERVVLRLLDKSARLYTLPEIGMDREVLVHFREAIRLEHGLILVTGPTGSGKSTTLYGALQEINSRESNIVTLEDPIEYQIDGISQTQINVKKGLTFAAGLRSVLRQDPDVIMVGEIRDHETAVMAIQSALTGHLVFSTLHTNDAASAVTRLLDLGIEPYLVSSSLLAVLAQRLVRKVCPDCSEQRPASRQEVEFLRDPPCPLGEAHLSPLASGAGQNEGATEHGQLTLPEPRAVVAPSHQGRGETIQLTLGRGCSNCRETGYRGRVGIFELLKVDAPVRSKIQDRSNASEIRDVALTRGMRLLRDDGVSKILQGLTTVEEVSRVTVRAAI